MAIGRLLLRVVVPALLATGTVSPAVAQSLPLPRIESRDGRHALIVDGAPFLMLGAQANNSSNYPSALPRVWPVIERLHANTLEIPVAWEQIEPEEGRFDFSYLDALLPQARERGVRLVLLWFGTWKNTSPGYVPAWVKLDNRRFPRMRTPAGGTHYALSPHYRSTLEADRRAFVQLMRYLAENDPQNTVIMVQPQNEAGVYGQNRDHSPEAVRLFEGPIPADLARATGRSGNWTAAFGPRAESAFNSWHVARYIDALAAAGKAVKPLPMFANAAVGDAFGEPGASGGASGGPDWGNIDIWKAAAPHLDLVGPDLYSRDPRAYTRLLSHYARADNPLMVPETGNDRSFARFLWPALGHGAIGWAPFGMDATGYSNHPLGAVTLDDDTIAAFARTYAFLAPQMRGWALNAYRHPTWGATKGQDAAEQAHVFGRWRVAATYEEWQFGDRSSPWLKSEPPPTAGQPVGGVTVIATGPDQFLIAGSDVRVRVGLAEPRDGETGMMVRVEEGTLADDGSFRPERVWNGDQTDYGLNITAQPVLLRVTMGSFRG